MKRRTVQVNLLLLGLAALWVYLLADNWGMAEGEGRLDSPGPGPEAAAASSLPDSPVSASDAGAIAGHHLFHSDRHNDLPEEAVEEQQVLLRPAPVLMGTMGIGGEEVALMVSGSSRSSGGLYRRLKVGEELDGYTLVRIEADRVVMKTGNREVKVGLHDRSRKPRRTARTPSAARTAGPARTTRSRTTGVGSGSSSRERREAAARRRQTRSRSQAKQLPKTWEVPVGTVVGGKRLVEESTPFGPVRSWVEDKSK